MHRGHESESRSYYFLSVVVVAILLLTLTPNTGPEETVSTFCILCGSYGTADFILNVLMFVPLGYLIARATNSKNRALIMIASITVAIELVQTLIPGRYPALGDVVANIVGGAVGIWAIHVRAHRATTSTRRARQTAIRAAPFALTATLVLTVVLLRPALPDTTYYGQWTADLGQFAQYHGQVHGVRVGATELPGHRLDVGAARAVHRMARGEASLVVDFLTGPHPSSLAPVFSVFDEHQIEVLVVGVDAEAIIIRMRRLAGTLGLHAPEIRFERFHPPEGTEVTLRLTREEGLFCIRLEGMDSCRTATTPARGWSLLIGIPLPSWATGFLDAVWLTLLGFVTVTFATRRSMWFLPVLVYVSMWLLYGGDPAWVPGFTGLITGSAGAILLRTSRTAVVS